MESTAAVRTSRRRPFYTCGVSFSEIALIAYKKTDEFIAPWSSMSKRKARIVSLTLPLVIAVQYVVLAYLSFIDNMVLAVESIVEAILPPTKHMFNKIDEIVLVVETLPEKFDEVVNNFPETIDRVESLNPLLALAVSWLCLLVSMLNSCASGSIKEEEIVVDIKCDEASIATIKESVGNRIESDSDAAEKRESVSQSVTDPESLQEGIDEEATDIDTNYATGESEEDGEDPILDLFESSWLMSSSRPRSLKFPPEK